MNLNFQPDGNEKKNELYKESHSGDVVTHTVVLQNRKLLEISGVKDVIRFDDLGAELATTMGNVIVEGVGLRIGTFDTERGVVSFEGEIRTIDYYESYTESRNDKKRGLFGKRP